MDEFPRGWRLLPLEECMEAIIDYRGKTPKKVPFGVPLVTAKIVKGGWIDYDAARQEYIAFKDYDVWMRRGLPMPGDVVMTTEAPLGEIAQLDERKVALAQRLITLRGKPGFLDNTYLKFLMLSSFVQDQLQARATGTTVLGIRQRELRKVALIVPPINEQDRIADILGTLDDKIEVNRRINRTLEAMAQALYKHWFVDFGPFQDGEFVESELGLIPKGWKVGALKDICHLTMGMSPKSEFYNEDGEGLPFHQGVTDFGDRFPTHRRYCTVVKRVADKGAILLSVRAPVGRINISDQRIVIGRGLAAIRHRRDFGSFLLYQIKSIFTQEDTMGSGTIFNSVSKDDLGSIYLVAPPKEIVRTFEHLVSTYDQQIAVNYAQNRSLAATRDYLLPKLLSGEILVEVAEEATADVM